MLSTVSHFIEYLNPITLPVANVYEIVVPKGYAVHDLHERTTSTRIRLLFGALMPPLSEISPFVRLGDIILAEPIRQGLLEPAKSFAPRISDWGLQAPPGLRSATSHSSWPLRFG